MKYECEICAEMCTKSKMIECGYCNLNACRDCNKTYLLSITGEIHCMKCKNKWNLEFCHKYLTQVFINGEYKKHQTELLFETEKSRFPETMPFVETYMTVKRKRIELKEIRKKEKELAKWLKEIKLKKYEIQSELYDLEHWGRRRYKKKKEERRTFIHPCSVNGCLGFLSTKWKCAICNIYTCSKCRETKTADHVCKEENLKSAELIRKETRNCPSCGVNIYKISGCDQMWCVQCQVAFSWKTGLRVNGIVHNPHYYQWRREGGRNIRNAGEVHCGGIPDFRWYEQKIYRDDIITNTVIYGFPGMTRGDNSHEFYIPKTYTTYQSMLSSIHRAVIHFQEVILHDQRTNCNILIDNQQLRVQYLSGDLSEDRIKQILISRKLGNNKEKVILDVYELLNTVWTESMIQIYNNCNVQTIQEEIQRMTRVTILANKELIKICQMYDKCVYVFAHNFYPTVDSQRKFTKKFINEVETGCKKHQYVRNELDFGDGKIKMHVD